MCSCPFFGSEFSVKTVAMQPFSSHNFMKNADENLSAVVHFQCSIFKRFNI